MSVIPDVRMHKLVRDLYKRVIMVGRDYPGGLELVRRKVASVNSKVGGSFISLTTILQGEGGVCQE